MPGGRLAEPGDTLVTTLDAKVQEAAQDALVEDISLAHRDGQYNANGGAAVVLDVRNGEVLAMASYPTYDPAVWVGGISEKEYKSLLVKKSRTTRRSTAPSPRPRRWARPSRPSQPSPVSRRAMIREPGTAVWCPGRYESESDYAEKTKFGCWAKDGHGTLDGTGAITQSCDTYSYHVGDMFFARKGEALATWANVSASVS